MKALLYKDLLVLWKQMKFVIFMVAIFCLLPNLGFGLNNMWVVYAGLVIPTSLLAYDERARWDNLAEMLPYSPRQLVLSRYVFGWGATLFAGVFYCIGLLINGQESLETGSFATLAALFAVVLVFQAVLFPLIFRMGVEKARVCMILVIAGVMGVWGASAYLLEKQPALLPHVPLPPVLVVAVVLCLASVKAAEKQYAGRRW